MSRLRKLSWLLFSVALLLVFDVADAQIAPEDSIRARPIDLAVELTYDRNALEWVLRVANNSDVRVHDVKVDIDTGIHEVLVSRSRTSTGLIRTDDGTSFAGGVLTIPGIGPRQAREFEIDKDESAPLTGHFLLRVEIIASSPKETPGLEHNSRAEVWAHVNKGTGLAQTDATSMAVLASATELRPPLDGQTTFNVAAKNVTGRLTGVAKGTSHKEDLQVKLTLTPGLSFASSMADTTISGSSAIWRVGDLPEANDATRTKTLDVPVNLSGISPLETRCLTAEVHRVIPPDPEDRRHDDVARVCLGSGPLEVLDAWPRLSNDWEMRLFTSFPCVGVTDYPCNMNDTVELVVEHFLELPYPTLKQRRDDGATPATSGSAGRMYLQPQSVVVHVDDPRGRGVKDGKVIWSTGDLMNLTDDWRHLTSGGTVQQAATVTAPGGGTAPGRWRLINTAETFTLLDATSSTRVTFAATNLSALGSASNYFVDVKVDFWELGTYSVFFENMVTLSGTTYTDSATYTFHVGPLADLEVRDAGPNSAVPGNQRAYTIEAVNHGPSDAAAVEVALTGVPGGARVVASQGSYDPDTGIWRIGELEHVGWRPLVGKGDTENLTIISEDGVPTPITARIRSTGRYTVCIDSNAADVDASSEAECTGGGHTWHTAEYYDPITGNNRANIAAHLGTGEGDPRAPSDLNLIHTAIGNIVVWGPVNTLNGYPVTHYEVERADASWKLLKDDVAGLLFLDMSGSSAEQVYRVRAVSRLGVAGPWTMSAGGLLPPSIPRNFTAALITDHDALLTWSSAFTGEAVTHYILQGSDHAGGPWSHLARLDGGATTWIHPNLPASGADKFYRIRAHGPLTHSEWAATSVGLKTPDAGAATGLRAQRYTTRQGNHGIQVWLGPYACGVDEADCLTLIEFRQAGSSAWFFGSREFSDIGGVPWDPDASYFTDGAGRNAAVRLDAAYDIRVCKLTDAQIEAKHAEGKPEGTWCVGHATGQVRVPAGE